MCQNLLMKKYLVPLFYGLLALFSAYMLFYNLGSRVLWADEAETALLAQNINRFGVPKVSDGKNTVTVLGSSIDSNSDGLWIWAPWLDKYIAAGSFRLFGKSTLSARLPFAFASFAALWLAVLLARKLYGDDRYALFTGFILASSQFFVLHARQCRYYALLFLGAAWLLIGVRYIAEGKSLRGALHTAGALAVLFYSNYLAAAGNILALLAACVFFRRGVSGVWKAAGIAAAAFAALVLPWTLYARIWEHGGVRVAESFFSKLWAYAMHVNFWVFPFVLLLVPPAAKWFARLREKNIAAELKGHSKKERRELLAKTLPAASGPSAAALFTEKFIWLSVPAQLVLLAYAPANVSQRYLCVLAVPLAVVSSALLLRHAKGTVMSAGLAVLFFGTNLPAFVFWPWRGDAVPQSPACLTAAEVSVPYKDRLDDILAYFRANAKPDQTVYGFDPEFAFIFYTGMKVTDGRFAGAELPVPPPDWVFADTASGVTAYSMRLPDTAERFYERVDIPVHDTKRASAIPESDMHERFTPDKMTVFPVYKLRAI